RCGDEEISCSSAMTFRILRKFEKKLDALSPNFRQKFFERADLFLKDKFHPLLNNHSVENRFPGCRSINVTGDYRAIFKEQNGDTIFMNIGTHSDFYSE
ncbi:MAG: hypothetical protein AAB862_00695, partial [Patescibacteria group bacterium]